MAISMPPDDYWPPMFVTSKSDNAELGFALTRHMVEDGMVSLLVERYVYDLRGAMWAARSEKEGGV